MFFCENCQQRNNWPTSFSRSHGRCEVCGKSVSCYDVPSGALPPVAWTLYEGDTDKVIKEVDMPAITAARIRHFLDHPETGIKYERRPRPKRKNNEAD